MNSTANPTSQPAAAVASARRAWFGLVLIGVVSLIVMFPLVLVAGCFRMGKDTRAVRDNLHHLMPNNGDLQTQIEIHGGALTLGLARVAASCIDEFPPEARMFLEAVRGTDVGIYEFRRTGSMADRAAYIDATTKALNDQSWERAAIVIDREETVMVFVPGNLTDDEVLRACVVFLHGRNLVVVSATLDPEPVIALVRQHAHGARIL